MKKVSLNLNGESTVLGGPGPRAQQLIDFVKSIPDGKFFDTDGIAKVTKSNRNATDQRLRAVAEELEGYTLMVPSTAANAKRKIFGSKAGVKALKKELQDAGLI